MIFRSGDEQDIVKVSRLWNEMVYEKRPEWTPNMDWWRDIAVKNFRAGVYFFYVADEGGKLVGFTDFFIYKEPSTGQLTGAGQHLFLKKEYRDKKIGLQLMLEVLEYYKTHGVTTAEIYCFGEEQSMWEAKGFKAVRTLMRVEVPQITWTEKEINQNV
jgi:GNAT superfamily N-acetyltransferase